MPVNKDQSSSRIVRNFVAMTDKKMYTAKDIAIEAGINLKTARNQLRLLEKACVVVRINKRIAGRVYYRRIEADEAEKQALAAELSKKTVAQVAAENGCSRESIYQKMRECDTPFKRGFKLTSGEYAVLQRLNEKAEGMMSYDLHAVISLAKLMKLDLVNLDRLNERHYHYCITQKGREVLNAK